jgi:peptidoglycan/LPS O-acetylase OafA/YrhL
MKTLPPHLSHPKYRSDIDGLRAVAVLAVVAFHAFPDWMNGGFVGVDVFFVISGFLISSIIFENLEKGTFSFAEFYARRIKRIFPALLLVLIASYAFGWFVLFPDEYKQLGKHIAAGAGFASNFTLLSESGYFDNSSETKPLLHLWSLGIEEQFYIAWPLVLWISWRRKVNLLALTIIIALASFYLNVKGVNQKPVTTFYSPLTRFWELLCGSILAWLALYKKIFYATLKHRIDNWLVKTVCRRKIEADGRAFSNVLSIAGCFILAYGFWRISNAVSFPGQWAVVPVLGAALLIMAGPDAWVNRSFLSRGIVVWFGLISYPLYLWHWPLLSFARIVEGEVPSHTIRMVAVVLSVVLAWFTYKLIECPIRFGERKKGKVVVLVVLMAVVGCIGYYAYSRDGFKYRNAAIAVQAQLDDLTFNRFEKMNGWLCDSLTYKGSRCHYTGENPSVVIVGDSHAPRVYSGLRDYISAKGKGVAMYGGGNLCPPLLDVVTKTSSEEAERVRNCLLKTTGSLKEIISNPNIKEVILISRGPLYTTSNGFGDAERNTYGKLVLHFSNEPQGLRTNSDVYFGALATTLDSLLAAGKRVTYLHDFPELGFDIKRCVSRSIKLSNKDWHPCAVPRAQFEERNREFKIQVKKILDARPAIKVVDLADALCDSEFCYGGKDGVLYYTDDDHLSHRGSALVIQRLWDNF